MGATRGTDIVRKYDSRLLAIVAKRVSWVKSVFEKLLVGTSEHIISLYLGTMDEYDAELKAEVVVKVTAFKAKVNAAIALLKDAYRFNDRCGFNLGCRFSRNSYSRSCAQFPTPEKTSYKLAGLGAFKVDWNGCAYNCLRTCTVAEKNPVFEEKKHRDAIIASRTKYLSDLAAKVAAWKVEIAQWKAAAEKTLKEKALCLLPKSYCGVAPTQDQIDAFHAVLKQQAQQWINQVEQRLLAQVTALNTRITNSITSWSTRAN